MAQIVGAFLGYIGFAKSENALSFAELARIFEITSLVKLQNCKNIKKSLTEMNVMIDNLCGFSNYSVFVSH